MSALARYPVPRAVTSGEVEDSQLFFHLEPVDPFTFLRPLRATEQRIKAGAVEKPRLYFRLEPVDPSIFLRPFRAVEQGIPAGDVDAPRLYFRLEPPPTPPPVLEFLRPLRALGAIAVDRIDDLRPSRGVIPGAILTPTPLAGIYIPIFRPRRRH